MKDILLYFILIKIYTKKNIQNILTILNYFFYIILNKLYLLNINYYMKTVTIYWIK